MTERAVRTTAPTTAAAEAVASTPASETTPFNPVPLLVIIGTMLGAAAVIWFVPGIRAAVTVFFARGGH